MRIRDARADEGEDLAFVVELSEAASQPVTVSYETVSRPPGSRSATAGRDYTPPAAGASLTFAVGGSADADDRCGGAGRRCGAEADETFLVELSGAVGASLADPSAVGTINGDVTCVDLTPLDSVPPPVTVTSLGAGEGDGEMTFTVRTQRTGLRANNSRQLRELAESHRSREWPRLRGCGARIP